MMVLMTPVCQKAWCRKNSVEPDALVFATLTMEEQHDQCRVEEQIDAASAENPARDVFVKADW